MRSGFLHLAEALAFREDVEVVSSTVRALITTLRSGEKCGVEPELVGKGTWAPTCDDPGPAILTEAPTPCSSPGPGPGSAVGASCTW